MRRSGRVRTVSRQLAGVGLAIAILALWAVLPAAAAELQGKVTAVTGSDVRIEVEGDLLPQVGDLARLSFSIPGGGPEVPVGQWRVTAVTADGVQATKVQATGTPTVGQTAKIDSASPTRHVASIPSGQAAGAPGPALPSAPAVDSPSELLPGPVPPGWVRPRGWVLRGRNAPTSPYPHTSKESCLFELEHNRAVLGPDARCEQESDRVASKPAGNAAGAPGTVRPSTPALQGPGHRSPSVGPVPFPGTEAPSKVPLSDADEATTLWDTTFTESEGDRKGRTFQGQFVLTTVDGVTRLSHREVYAEGRLTSGRFEFQSFDARGARIGEGELLFSGDTFRGSFRNFNGRAGTWSGKRVE